MTWARAEGVMISMHVGEIGQVTGHLNTLNRVPRGPMSSPPLKVVRTVANKLLPYPVAPSGLVEETRPKSRGVHRHVDERLANECRGLETRKRVSAQSAPRSLRPKQRGQGSAQGCGQCSTYVRREEGRARKACPPVVAEYIRRRRRLRSQGSERPARSIANEIHLSFGIEIVL